MSAGLDTMSNCQSHAYNIKQAGYSFVCRYYNTNNTSKNLTRLEANSLSNAGLYIVVVWENGYPTDDSYFTASQGTSDAQAALNYAKTTINQPTGTPIYFAVDYDAKTPAISGGIKTYFDAIQTVFYNSGYKIGVYGSGDVCSYIYSHVGAVGFTWLAQSRGWSGYSTYSSWNIKQGGAVAVDGLSCDSDQSNGSAGGFQVFN